MASPDPRDDRPTEPAPAVGEETVAWTDLSATTPYTPRWADPEGREPAGDDPPWHEVDEVDRFARAVVESGLVEPGELREALARSGPGAGPLARELVRAGRLTAYQAAAVLQGKAKGLRIGNYLVLDKLGVGGMGIVFKARHRRMNRVVAVKVLPPSFTKDRSALLRFQREAEAAAHLSHPNVVAALDADEFKGLHFLVMEYVEGRDLARLVREDGPLTVARAVDCVVQAARGLREAHARGIFHRDIKPSNLLVDGSGTVKVSDLGLARMERGGGPLNGPAAAGSDLTRDGAMMGTVDYMPPEQAFNSKHADHRSDVYSLGCTLYFLLTGRAPFQGETLMARLVAHRESPLPPVRDDRPDVPLALDAVLRTMTAKSPEARYPSMDALITDLEALRPGLPDSPAPRAVRPAPGRRSATTVVSPARTAPPATDPAPDATVVSRGAATAEARPTRPPASRRVLVVAAAVLGLTAVAVVTDRRRGAPEGALRVQDADADERVVIRRDGREVVGPTEARGFRLAPGEYEVAVVGRRPGLRVEPPRVKVERETQAVVRVKSDPPAVAPAPALAPTPEAAETLTPPPPPVAPPVREPVGVVRAFRHGAGQVEAVAVSADGRRAVSGGNDGMVRVWDLRAWREEFHLGHDREVFAVALAPDGRRAVSASLDTTVRLWDLDARAEAGRVGGHEGRVNAVAVSADGRRVLTGGDDGSAVIADATTGRPALRLDHGARVHAVAFSPEGLALTGGGDGDVRAWNADDGAEVGRFRAGGKVLGLAVSADGRLALTGGENSPPAVWDLDRRALDRRLEGGPNTWVCSAALLPGPRALTGYQNGKLVVWDVATGRAVRTFDSPAAHLGLAVLPDAVHALTADADGQVRLWRLGDDPDPTGPIPGGAIRRKP